MADEMIRLNDALIVAMSISVAMKKKGMIGQSNGAKKVADALAALAALAPIPVDASQGGDTDGKGGEG